jgi:hypothetical protein
MQIEVDTDPVLSRPLNANMIDKHNANSADGCKGISTYALRKYFHDVPTKNGSLLMASIAQNPIGIRTQFRPAAEIVLHVKIVCEGSSN